MSSDLPTIGHFIVLSKKGIHVSAKLVPKFSGTFIMLEVISPNIYKVG